MVPYSKKWYGLTVLFQAEGSALLRALFPALLACALNVVMHVTISADTREGVVQTSGSTTWRNPFHSIIMLCTFMLVFRTQVSHVRFMDARTATQTVVYALHEVVSQCRTFSEAGLSSSDAGKKADVTGGEGKGDEERSAAAAEEAGEVVVKVAEGREATRKERERAWELEEGDLLRERRWGRRIEHLASLMSALLFHELRRDPSLDNLIEHDLGSAARPEAQNVRSERGGLMDFLMLRSGVEFTARSCEVNPLQVLGGVSEGEASRLIHTIRTPERASEESVCGFHLAHEWLLRELVTESCSKQGVFRSVPPPILSRTFQLLGDAKHAAMQAKKITDTPLPFAYTQLAVVCTFFIAFGGAVMFSCIMPNSPYSSAIISFIMALFAIALNEVARELEDPFQCYANGIPVSQIQHDFNIQIRGTTEGLGPFWRTGRDSLAEFDPYD